jgi:predicted methyltransferase
MEQLCAASFRDAGHHVKMYTYGDVGNIPDGIEIADANDIMPLGNVIAHKRTGSPAPQADKWRYNMLAQCKNTIWADTDAYCVKPFTSSNGHFHGWESARHINNGVVGLPSDSETLAGLIDFTSDEYAIPDWFDEALKAEMRQKKEDGDPVHVGEQSWGVWGPQALTHFLHKTGEQKYAMPIETLFPVSFKKRRLMLKPNLDLSEYITDNTLSIHFWGRRMRMRIIEREGGEPDPDSLIGKLLKKHGIVPSDAPLPKKNPHKGAEETVDKAKAPAPAKRVSRSKKTTNLTDMADARDLDQGSKKHGYTELYNMLLAPYRDRAIKMGLLGIGDHDGKVSHELDMWLEFLPKASIHAMDWRTPIKTDKRASLSTVEFGSVVALDEAANDLPELDVILDDATHASHHQQNAFVALFPKLKSGGLYIIEDLRFQPKDLEKKQSQKTAQLFRDYLENKTFSHPDAEMQDRLNTLAADFSGCFMFQAKWQKDRRDQILVVHKR